LQRAEKGFADRNLFLALSWSFMQRGDLAEARGAAERAAYLFPDHLMPELLLGEIYHTLGNEGASREALARCIRRDTFIKSPEVERVARDAEALWIRLYGLPLPSRRRSD
jgi:hypothetical protein